jgi:hypothetical protein
MTTLLRIFSAVFQYDYEMVKKQPTLIKQKIVTLGTLLLIPIGLWALAGFYLSHHMMGLGIFGSFLASLILGLIIFAIDRSFISSPKTKHKKMLGSIRFAFALFSTVLGSLAIDMMLFSGDLEEYRQAKATDEKDRYTSEYRDKHQGEVLRILGDKEKAAAVHAELREIHRLEMDGEGGTGQKGFGKVATAKGLEKDKAAAKVEQLEQDYEKAKQELDIIVAEHGEQKSAKRGDALLSKFKDLHEFVFSDGFTIGLYLFFFGFVLLLECFFILYKSSVSETIFESFLQAEEDYAQQQLEAYRYAKARSVRDITILGEDHDKVKKILGSIGKRKAG